MLEPAILYKDELEKKFAKEMYTERYYYYVGYPHEFELPDIRVKEYYYQWAIVEPFDNFDNRVIGYLAYHVDPSTDNVDRFGLYSFSEGDQTVIRDTYDKLEELVRDHHRVEWRVIDGNHAKRGYDAFCKKHNGNIVCLHDVTKDLKGNYRNEYIYEIVKEVDSKYLDIVQKQNRCQKCDHVGVMRDSDGDIIGTDCDVENCIYE